MQSLQEVKESYVTPSRLEDSLFSKDLAPHYMKLAGQLASSELVPKGFRGKPQDLFICWAMGYQVGLTPEQSMQCIAVINGKPAMWGDDMLALCMAHKDFEDMIEAPIQNKDGMIIGYLCTVKRKGKAPKINEFTLDMAKKAGLLAKGGVWTQYPERMLKLRARGFSLRDAFPDALKGIKPREEIEDYIDAEYRVVDDKNLSRTELLKKDYLNKKGSNDAQENNGQLANSEDSNPDAETDNNQVAGEMDENGKTSAELYFEIKRLIAEKQFTEERLRKAMAYYEVEFIEELSNESAQHFIKQLNTLL